MNTFKKIKADNIILPNDYDLVQNIPTFSTLNGIETLTNKTIDNISNTVSATKLRGTPLNINALTEDDFLTYQSGEWKNQQLTTDNYISFNDFVISANVGTANNTLAAGNDNRFADAKILVVKKNSPGFGEFSTISSAVASITGSSSSNTFLIKVGPGIFLEPNITLPNYVCIIGSGEDITVVQAIADNDIFNLSVGNQVSEISIINANNRVSFNLSNACNASVKNIKITNGIAVNSSGTTGISNFSMTECNFSTSNSLININHASSPSVLNFYASNSRFAYGGSQTAVSFSGNYTAILSNLNCVSTNSVTSFFSFSDTGKVVLMSVNLENANIGVFLNNSVSFKAYSCYFENCETGVILETTYSGNAVGNSVSFHDCNVDFECRSINATGSLIGDISYSKTFIHTLSSFVINSRNLNTIVVSKNGNADFANIGGAISAILVSKTATVSNGSSFISGNFTPDIHGSIISGIGIPNDTIVSYINSTNMSLSNPATASGTDFYIFNKANENRKFNITVESGTYSENEIVIPAYTTLNGVEMLSCIIAPSSNSSRLITLSSNTSLNEITVLGRFSGFQKTNSVIIDSSDTVIIHNCRFSNSNTALSINADTGITDNVEISNCNFENCDVSIELDGTSTNAARIELSNSEFSFISGSMIDTLKIYGGNADCDFKSLHIQSNGTGVGVHVYNGAEFHGSGIVIENVNTGILADTPGGAAAKIDITALLINDTTTHISETQTNTVGSISGNFSYSNSNILSPNLNVNFTDNEIGGTYFTGGFNYGETFERITDYGTLIHTSATLGYVRGGAITVVGGLTINIAEGVGYYKRDIAPEIHQLYKLEFPSTNITLPDNSINYVYSNNSGVIVFSLTLPNNQDNILFGRVKTGSGAIEFIDRQYVYSHHFNNRQVDFLRDVIGAVFANGCIVTANASRNLNVTAGKYYYINNPICPVGGNITWQRFYRVSGVWTMQSQNVVDNTQYDNGTNLVNLTSGYYTKHSLYTLGDNNSAEYYFLVTGQSEYLTKNEAEIAALPQPPEYFREGIVVIASIIVQQNNTSVVEILDQRPRIGFSAASISSNSVTDHGNLTGLLDDDHPQYLLVNGTRSMTGSLNMGNNTIINSGTINGVTITSHGSRHNPGGADSLATAAPVTISGAIVTNAEGTAASFARSDHQHVINQATLSLNSIGGTLGVSKGGTGATTLTSGFLLQGNGVGAITASKVAPAGAVVGTTDTQTLTNKTLTAPVISTISNTGTLTLPTVTDTLVGRTTTDTLTNKVLNNSSVLFADTSDNTKRINFQTSGATTGTTLTLQGLQTANRVISFPNITDTLVSLTASQTLTNKTLTAPIISTISNTGTLTLPSSTDTLVGRATTDTLTNKTLTLPVISTISNSGTLTLPTGTDTLVGRTSVDTLTNKTLTGLVLSGNLSSAAWGDSGIQLRGNSATYTDTTSSGTVAGVSVIGISQPTLQSSNPVTYTVASTVNILNPPLAGTNVTIGTPLALNVNGLSRFSNDIHVRNNAGLNLYNSANTFFTDLNSSNSLTSNTVFTLPANNGSAGNVLSTDGAGVTSWISLSASSSQYFTVAHQLASGTNGGTFTSGVYQVRPLTVSSGNLAGASLASNTVTLPAGTYNVEGYAAAFRCGNHKTKLRNTTNNIDLVIGGSAWNVTNNNTFSVSLIRGFFTIGNTTNMQLQHRCNTTRANDGFGLANGYGEVEVYAQLTFYRI